MSEGALVLSIKEQIITLGALTSKAFRARDPVCHLLSERHSEIGRERERVLPGSEFSQGLLLVVVWCQGAVNGPLISFKRL